MAEEIPMAEEKKPQAKDIAPNTRIEEVVQMAEEKKPQAEKTAPEPSTSNTALKTRTSSPEKIEAVLGSYLQENPRALESLVEKLIQQRIDMMADKDRGIGVLELSDTQKKIEEEANLFKKRTNGPTNEQLKQSTKAPEKITDIYEDDFPEWARQPGRSGWSRSY